MDLIAGTDPTASWWLAVLVLVATTLVVAVLLRQIVATAAAIHAGVAEVWVRGQRVANNTIHIANLHRTAEAVERNLGRAGRIAVHSEAIRDHAEGCPGCPSCIWSERPGGPA